ncbi:hypothetical protein IAI10_20265 [Clostridium sp. 19966]|uniref:hypothetical protein n=1 Tax=Clostridium sp. 19966 TaxID=2768166 RepID=UPI0028DEDE46|nr:hypothetical protein [Clostridium sp. 19966]MDT8718992.1 hypothetical protein [Clostridium sp. 19966]
MNKLKAKLASFKAKITMKIHKKLNKIAKIKANTVADLFTILSLFIIFGTTFMLNKAVGMYILAAELLIVSYFISKK